MDSKQMEMEMKIDMLDMQCRNCTKYKPKTKSSCHIHKLLITDRNMNAWDIMNPLNEGDQCKEYEFNGRNR